MYGAQSSIDFGLVILNAFLLFFVGLVIWLRREDRREGYPLEDDEGRLLSEGGLLSAALPKTFILPFGRGEVTVPNNKRDSRPLSARRTSVTPGSPLVPSGDPMTAGIGPGSYAQRAKLPDLTAHGEVRMAPLRVATGYTIAEGDDDPRGLTVVGTDGVAAGTVKDVWVDRGEATVRYLEVALSSGGASVMLPITMANVDYRRKQVVVDAITAAQFAGVPRLTDPDQITFDEEERVTAYYGAGFLYATPSRLEPLI
jgi:photosynthetic reaction center H subunit